MLWILLISSIRYCLVLIFFNALTLKTHSQFHRAWLWPCVTSDNTYQIVWSRNKINQRHKGWGRLCIVIIILKICCGVIGIIYQLPSTIICHKRNHYVTLFYWFEILIQGVAGRKIQKYTIVNLHIFTFHTNWGNIDPYLKYIIFSGVSQENIHILISWSTQKPRSI